MTLMWVKDSAGSGRVNLDLVTRMSVAGGTGGTVNVLADLQSVNSTGGGVSVTLAAGLATPEDAAAFMDNLILNGS